MSDLSDLLAQYGQGYRDPRLDADSADYSTADVLRRLPAANPVSRGLRGLTESIPANAELPKPQFPLDPRSMSALNMLKGWLGSTANWLDQRPEIGPDTLAPLGLGAASIVAGAAKAPVMTGPSRLATLRKAIDYHLREHDKEYGPGVLPHSAWLSANAVGDLGAAWTAQYVAGLPYEVGIPAAVAGSVYPHAKHVGQIYRRLREIEPQQTEWRAPDLGSTLFADSSRSSLPGTVVNGLEQTVNKTLPMDDASRLQRARDAGFDTDKVWYHGTDAPPFEAFHPPAYFTTSHDAAVGWPIERTAWGRPMGDPKHMRVEEVYLKNAKPYEWSDGTQQAIIDNPSHIRRTNAAFDPAKKDSGNLLAVDPRYASTPGTLLSSSRAAPEQNDLASLLARYGNSF